MHKNSIKKGSQIGGIMAMMAEYEDYYGFVNLAIIGNSCIYAVNKTTGETRWIHFIESSKMQILKLIKPSQLEESKLSNGTLW